MNNRQLPFWVLTISLLIALIIPVLIKDGMFMDGVLYTCVAKNMANGIGTFWFPKFSEFGFAGNANFHEHPPLVFGIQAIFFKILGNSIYVERFYSFLTACITAYIISRLWKLLVATKPGLVKLSWLPVLLWIIIPVCYWSYQNNIHENTMGIFTLLSVYFSLRALYSCRKIYFYLILSGIFIFLASFSKGIPGLFPIGVIGIYWIISRDIPLSKMLIYTIILIVVPSVIYLFLLINNEAYESLSIYFNHRLLGRIESAPTVDSRSYILLKLFMELLPVLVITIIMLTIYKLKLIKQKLTKSYIHKIIILILIGSSGSVPLIITLVQKRFYFAHALPFFAIGFALLIAPGLLMLISKINTKSTSFKIFRIVTIIVFVSTLVFSGMQVGKTSRNINELHDVYLIGEIVPHHSTINIDKSMWNNWNLQCYLIRHFNISVDVSDNYHDFYLTEKKSDATPQEKFTRVDLETKRFNLYKRNEASY